MHVYIYTYTKLGGLLRGALSLGPEKALPQARKVQRGKPKSALRMLWQTLPHPPGSVAAWLRDKKKTYPERQDRHAHAAESMDASLRDGGANTPKTSTPKESRKR